MFFRLSYFFRASLYASCFFGHLLLSGAPLKVSLASDAAIVMNAETGAILFEKDAYKEHYPASITKIATALYTLQQKRGSLEEEIVADQEAVGSITEEAKIASNYKIPPYRMVVGGSHIGLKRGEKMSLRALLYGLMLVSGDDAANVIAQHVGGTIPQFMVDLNAYLKKIGCQRTTFLNPHGLHFPGHTTTAYDMAVLTREALKDPLFCEISSSVRYTRPKTNKQDPTTWVQTNRLLRAGPYYYPKAIGVKTGRGSPALNTLVAAAKEEDRTLIVVLLHAQERNDSFKDAIALFEAAFNEKKMEKVYLKEGAQTFVLSLEGASQPVKTYLEAPLVLQYYPAEEPRAKAFLAWEDVKLPISKGQKIGEVRLVTPEGRVLVAAPLQASHDATASWWWRLSSWFRAS